ncbi:tyrosine-protein phosphatase [Paenibacillus ginsengarvi]|uniref:tyrosine-protein phosphatase n=1 Tax=Paenibacillus ginsengarvi TaxID=400777 RepID=UPI001315A85D|nr:tyrosine-protein phosphatase [Paenibacillus ginsengarvi]
MTTTRITDYPADRVIALEGASNFRDMGGYTTEDGRSVKFGLLFRADELGGLTENDLQALDALRMKTILDYRSENEALRSPTPERIGSVYRRIEANPVAASTSGRAEDYLASGALNHDTMVAMYAKLPFANPAYRFLMESLSSPEALPIVHHCAGGKDRTGVGAALILKLLGVSDRLVMEDYMLTNETLGPKMEKLLQSLSGKYEEPILRNLRDVFAAKEVYMQTTLEAVIRTYGDWDTYFANEFGITPEQRDRIREYVLE